MTKELYLEAAQKITAIETEMKKVGAWSNQAFNSELLEDMGAFGQRTMPLEYWLQFVLIPRVNEIIEKEEEFPPSSSVGSYACREFDGRNEYNDLITLLIEFDGLFNKP